MSVVTEFFPWVLWRRIKCQMGISGFKASVFSFADAKCLFSEGSKIHKGAFLYDTHLGVCTYTWARMVQVRVGNFCSIGRAVIGGQGQHPTRWLSTHPAFYSTAQEAGLTLVERDIFDGCPSQTKIGNDVWIGDGAVVMEGCEIGDGAIIAAAAVVTKDVQPYAIVGGVPAKLIRYRFGPEVISALQQWKWWNLDRNTLRRLASSFTSRSDWSVETIEALKREAELSSKDDVP